MAFTDNNIILTKDTPQNVLLGASTSFIVQNTSAGTINFKIKDSTAAGGIIPSEGTFSFACDVTLFTNYATYSHIYIIRD